MHRKTITLAAGGAGVCMLFGAWYMLKEGNERAEQQALQETQNENIVNINTENISRLTFQIDGEEAVFEKDGEEWSYENDSAFPVNPAQIDSVLGCLAPLEAVRTLEEITDPAEYGVEDAQNVITVTDSQGEETKIAIGDTNSGTGDDYIMLDDNSSVIYTVGTSLREAVSLELIDYAQSDDLPYLMSQEIVQVLVEREDGQHTFYLEDGTWREEGSGQAEAETEPETETDAAEETTAEDETDAAEETAAEDETATEQETESETEGAAGMTASEIETAVSSLGGLGYLDYIEYNCEDLSKYGLGEGASKLTIVYEETEEEETEADTEEQEETTENGSEEESETEEQTESKTATNEVTFYVGDLDESGNYYVQLDGSVQVHTITVASISSWFEEQ